MANTYTLIASNTLGSSAASVTFSSIPNTYTDLVIKCSTRDDSGLVYGNIILKFNGSSSNLYSRILLYGNGASANSTLNSSLTSLTLAYMGGGGGSTSNTFSNTEVYIPSYTASQNKPLSAYGAQETNATTAYINAQANLWRNTSAIDSIELASNANFVSGSSFFLYGIKNS